MRFEDFLAARLGALLRYATAITADPHLAQDVVQEVMVRAHARWGSIAAMQHPEAYVRRMVVNEFISDKRRRSAVPIDPQTMALHAGAARDGTALVDERDRIVQLLVQLPPKQRAVIALRYYEDLPDAQIADLLHCSEGTVRSQAFRALATLRQALALAESSQRDTDADLFDITLRREAGA